MSRKIVLVAALIALAALVVGVLRIVGADAADPVLPSKGVRTSDSEVEVPANARVRATLAGTVVVPKEWNREKIVLIAELLDDSPTTEPVVHLLESREMKRIPATLSSWSWKIPNLVNGRYRVALRNPAYSIEVELGPDGRDDVVLAPPMPAKVAVCVVDADTGEVLKAGGISWQPKRFRPASDGEGGSADMNPESGMLEFQAPRCDIEIHVWRRDYAEAKESLRVHAGLNELTIGVVKLQGIEVILMDGNTPLRPDVLYQLQPQVIGGDGQTTWRSTTEKGFRIAVSKPGKYRFYVPPIDGYMPVPEQELLVKKGEFTERVIQLKRK